MIESDGVEKVRQRFGSCFQIVSFSVQRHFLSYYIHELQTGDRWIGRSISGPANHKTSPAETQYGCGSLSPNEKRKTRRSLDRSCVSGMYFQTVFSETKGRALLNSICIIFVFASRK